MKIIPLFLLTVFAFFCGSIRERLQPATPSTPRPTPSQTVVDANNQGPNSSDQRVISGGFLNDKAKSLPSPTYPPAARAVRASGAVIVQVLVNEQGKVVSASVASGHPLLRAAAEHAARQAEFEPMIISGQKVRFSGILKYNFKP
jgi:TonB family protein